jgi:glutamate synthase domain-containing protein 2
MAEEKKQVSIQDFIVKKEKDEKEIKLDRFSAPFIVQEVTNEENEALQKKATSRIKNQKTGQLEPQVNQSLYADLLIAKSVVQPDLQNAELQKAYGTMGDEAQTLRAMLKVSEFNIITRAVTDFAGITESVDEDVKTVKN